MGQRTDDLDYGSEYGTEFEPANAPTNYSADYLAGGNAGEAAYYGTETPPTGTFRTAENAANQADQLRGGETTHDEEGEQPSEIRDNIQQTRQQMSHTIDAIQEKLSPQHLVHEAKHAVRDATIGRAEEVMNDVTDTVQSAGSSILDTIRENPIPTALAAVGLGWLIMKAVNNAQANNQPTDGYQGYARPSAQRYSYGAYPTYQSRYGGYNANQGPVGQATSAVQNAASNVTDKVQDVAGNVADTVQDTASNVADTAQQLASQAQDQVQQIGYQAEAQMYRARNWLEQTWESNPLALGAAALAAGAIIGGLIPETQMEDRLMGDQRDTLLQKAEGVAEDTVQKVQSAAEQALGTVKQNVTQSQTQKAEPSATSSKGQTSAQSSTQSSAASKGSTTGTSKSATSGLQTPPPPTTETSSQAHSSTP